MAAILPLPVESMSHTEAVAARQRATDLEKNACLEGFRASISTLPGIVAWGLVSGMAMVKSGLTIWQALGMSLFVFAGSAQLAALPLIAVNTPVLLVFATAMVVNLRFIIFSAIIGPHFAHLRWYQRIWYGYFNTDITMGFFPQRFPASTLYKTQGKVGFLAGVGYPNWCAWQAGAIAGIVLAGQIPESWDVGFAGTLALLAVMIPLTVNLAAAAGVLAAGTIAIIAIGLPYRLGLLAAIVAGVAVAMTVDRLIGKTDNADADDAEPGTP